MSNSVPSAPIFVAKRTQPVGAVVTKWPKVKSATWLAWTHPPLRQERYAGDVTEDDMLRFWFLHANSREPNLIYSACATFTVIQLSTTLQISQFFLFILFFSLSNSARLRRLLQYDSIQFHRIVCKMLFRHTVINIRATTLDLSACDDVWTPVRKETVDLTSCHQWFLSDDGCISDV